MKILKESLNVFIPSNHDIESFLKKNAIKYEKDKRGNITALKRQNLDEYDKNVFSVILAQSKYKGYIRFIGEDGRAWSLSLDKDGNLVEKDAPIIWDAPVQNFKKETKLGELELAYYDVDGESAAIAFRPHNGDEFIELCSVNTTPAGVNIYIFGDPSDEDYTKKEHISKEAFENVQIY